MDQAQLLLSSLPPPNCLSNEAAKHSLLFLLIWQLFFANLARIAHSYNLYLQHCLPTPPFPDGKLITLGDALLHRAWSLTWESAQPKHRLFSLLWFLGLDLASIQRQKWCGHNTPQPGAVLVLGFTMITLMAPGQTTHGPTPSDGWLEGARDHLLAGTLKVRPYGL